MPCLRRGVPDRALPALHVTWVKLIAYEVDEGGAVDVSTYLVRLGCRYCVIACPYQNRTFLSKAKNPGYFPGHEKTAFEKKGRKLYPHQVGTTEKCNFCAERIDAGMAQGLTPGVDRDATPACGTSRQWITTHEWMVKPMRQKECISGKGILVWLAEVFSALGMGTLPRRPGRGARRHHHRRLVGDGARLAAHRAVQAAAAFLLTPEEVDKSARTEMWYRPPGM